MKVLEFCMKHRDSKNPFLRLFSEAGLCFFRISAKRIEKRLRAFGDVPEGKMPSADEMLKRASARRVCRSSEN